MLTALAIITTTVVGTMVGVEFAVAVFVNPIFLRLPAGAALQARADGGRVLGRVMPFWYVGSLVLIAGLAAATWGRPGAGAGAAVAAAALLAVSVVMSVALLVPINNRSVTWTADDHPDDYREQQQRWDRLHYARVAIIVAGFVLTVAAATVR
jgi:anthrone oxygenase-like protein